MLDEMAANSLQTEEKTRLTLQNQKEKYQSEFERLEKENNELKVLRKPH
jgi:hypothetical protein